MVKFYGGFIKPGNLCFDIGANIGNYSTAFLDLGARVIAVEPIDENFKHLNERFADVEIFFAVQAAVSVTSGTSQMFKGSFLDLSTLDEHFVEFNKEHSRNKWLDTQTVQLTTLDELIKKYGVPHFCKIDVEGHEKQVLAGLTQTIPVISFEYLFPFKERALECIKRVAELSPNSTYNYSLYEFFELENDEWLDLNAFLIQIQKLSKSHWTGDIFCKLS